MDTAIFIVCGLGILLSVFLLYGVYLNKKRNKDKNLPGIKRKSWIGWSIYGLGVLALGYWVFYSYSVHSKTGGLSSPCFIIWTILGGWLMVKVPKRMKLIDSPEKSEVVKVISKTAKTDGNYVVVGTSYFVSFEFPDGDRKNFSVNVNQYNSVAESETGTLTYKGHDNDLMFIHFQRQP